MQLSKKELIRYSRHLIMPEFGEKAQLKLKEAKVLVVGCGGLGCPVLQYLVAAGVGTIGIVDFDLVDESNLQRQILFSVDDIGNPKAEVAAEKLKRQNPLIEIHTHPLKLTSENALELINKYDIVADGTDNFPTRYLINDACVILGKTNVFASIFKFEGQIAVFNHKQTNGSFSPNYRDLFPEPPLAGSIPSCADAGVIGVLPGIVGCIQANEVIKLISGVGEPLVGKLLSINSLTLETHILRVSKSTNRAPIKELIDYQGFCGIKKNRLKQISRAELIELQNSNEEFQFIDVREPHEFQEDNLGAELIPIGELEHKASLISREKKVVIHCLSGSRSAQAISLLQSKGFKNLFNLQGGILEYRKEEKSNSLS